VRERIRTHTDLEVYRLGMEAAMEVFALSEGFPREEACALTDQIRRSSRSVCANLAEAWRKRRYPAAFVSTLCLAEAEAAETQTWLDFALRCGYLDAQRAAALSQSYDRLLGKIVVMIQHPEQWLLPQPGKETHP
jgi:four helix bundle protein